tara:strand:- start:733 stop:933 length:201 start_codon:yes stop_codon:yes gene_type:complete
MEVLLLGLLGAGVIWNDNSTVELYSSVTPEEMYVQPASPIDFTKQGNYVIGDNSDTSLQWIIVTGE